MRAVKIFLSIFFGFVLLLALALFVLYKNIDPLIEMAIETVGPEVTKTTVEVDRVRVELTKGRGNIYGIAIGNPPGYTSEHLFYMQQIGLTLDTSTLRKDVIVIKEILIDGAQITAEHKGVADINVRELLANMSQESTERKPDSPTTASPNLRFMVERFVFTNAGLSLVSEQYGRRDLSMADIRLNNLGDREQGLSAEQLTRAILSPVLEGARRRAEQALREQVGGQLQERLQEHLSEEDRAKAESLRSLLGR